MSRLILEGNTTERFGVKYPKPYIEKIEVQDAVIIPYVYLYMQVEEDVTTAADIDELLEDLAMVVIFGDLSEDVDIANNYVYEFVYSSQGVKFAKIFSAIQTGIPVTNIGYNEISQITEPIYFGAFTYAKDQDTLYKTPEPTTFDKSGIYKKYEAVASQLSYELVINSDGTPADDVIAYLQTDGNYFGRVPLQSLDRSYRNTDNISHRQVINTINNIISPFVGIVTEADNMSMTLDEYSDNPRLLLEIKKQINSFSNKSSSTTTGALYENLVDAVSQINSALESQPVLQKRLVKNTKIVDRRSTTSAPYLTDGFYEDGGSTLPLYQNKDYIYDPLVSRRIAPIVPTPSSDLGDYCVVNESFVFFDYEKALNYKSKISKFLNVYNIQELFGRNCLNTEFRLDLVTAAKSEVTTAIFPIEVRELVFDPSGANFIKGSKIRNKTYPDYEYYSKKLYDANSQGEEYVSKLLPRNFEANLGDYRLMCFYLTDIEKLSQQMTLKGYLFRIFILDNTMVFYNNLRRKLSEINVKLLEYQEFAQEFCSFNNLDGRFNDFFVDKIREQFDAPYPWEEAPIYFASLEALLVASYGSTNTEFITANRQDTRQSLDLDFIKQIATIQSSQISPEAGDLENLQKFVETFSNLMDKFGRGTGLDISQQIYNNDTELSDFDALKQKSSEISISRSFRLPSEIINSYRTQMETILNAEYSIKRNDNIDGDDFGSYTFEEIRQRITDLSDEVYPRGVPGYQTKIQAVLDGIRLTIYDQEQLSAKNNITWEKYINNYYENLIFSQIGYGFNFIAGNQGASADDYDPSKARDLMQTLIPAIQKMQEIDDTGILTIETFYQAFLGAQ
jgi:hypothetical protein